MLPEAANETKATAQQRGKNEVRKNGLMGRDPENARSNSFRRHCTGFGCCLPEKAESQGLGTRDEGLVSSPHPCALIPGFPQPCRKWRIPVKTIASPNRSAAAITSGSRTEPPG